MDRRVFLHAACSGVLPMSFPVAGQSPNAVRVAMVLTTSPLSEMVGTQPQHPGVRAFLETLTGAVQADGQALVFEPRSAEGRPERYSEIFGELLRMQVSVIVTIGELMTQKAKEATSTVPIVMAYSNYPVEAGVVQSLARPGGNVTGVNVSPTAELEAKRLQLLKEAMPGLSRVAFLGLRSEWDSPIGRSVQSGAGRLGLKVHLVENTLNEYGAAFAAMSRDRPDAIFVANSPVNYGHRNAIVALATKARLPGSYQSKEFVAAGGLMSYGINVQDQFRRAAAMVARILRGARPADLPIEQPNFFELAVNVATATTLGLSIPQSLLLRVDELFQ